MEFGVSATPAVRCLAVRILALVPGVLITVYEEQQILGMQDDRISVSGIFIVLLA